MIHDFIKYIGTRPNDAVVPLVRFKENPWDLNEDEEKCMLDRLQGWNSLINILNMLGGSFKKPAKGADPNYWGVLRLSQDHTKVADLEEELNWALFVEPALQTRRLILENFLVPAVRLNIFERFNTPVWEI